METYPVLKQIDKNLDGKLSLAWHLSILHCDASSKDSLFIVPHCAADIYGIEFENSKTPCCPHWFSAFLEESLGFVFKMHWGLLAKLFSALNQDLRIKASQMK